MNISYGNDNEDLVHEAILPLPTCRSRTGCRTVIKAKDKEALPEFKLHGAYHIQSLVSQY